MYTLEDTETRQLVCMLVQAFFLWTIIQITLVLWEVVLQIPLIVAQVL
jgi:hypothetical protein